MSAARKLLWLLALLWPSGACAQTNPDLAVAQELAKVGAYQLALDRIEQYQPRNTDQVEWPQWEGLRCQSLSALGRHGELIQRIDAFRPDAVSPPFTACLIAGARAALVLQKPDLSQSYAALVLWLSNSSLGDMRAARLAVIDAHLAARHGEAAFRAMLRYQQDFQPVDPAIAGSWVDGLLALGMDREALNWLPQLDEKSPAKLALRVKSGLVSPDAAIAQARAALSKRDDVRYWRLIADVGMHLGKTALQIEGLEHVVNASGSGNAGSIAKLWEAYDVAARQIGNEQRLLRGDDSAWADYAGRRLGTEPQLSRAVFADLARNAQDVSTRRTAQLQLVHSLHETALDRVALQLFERDLSDVEALDASTRYWLGNAAEAQGQAALAARFLRGLPAPPGVDSDEWTLRVARLTMRSGVIDAGVIQNLTALYAGRKSLSRPLVHGIAALAEELLDGAQADAAGALFEVALPYAERSEARTILFGLGRAREAAGQRRAAATAYLRSALLADARSPDAAALDARLRAALNLARAGYREDARKQFQWLLENSRQPAHLDIARRELSNQRADRLSPPRDLSTNR
ncbi:MAG TPA: hypothetical protein VLN59_13520 [Burkholderiales bacterium]|nr:hypothetical protein [Burkholderiales bacterium]